MTHLPNQRDWVKYYDAVAGKPPRETLVYALDAFEFEDSRASGVTWRDAVDIGCGEGRDTREILGRSGSTRWKLQALDNCPEGLIRLSESLANHWNHDWLLSNCSMEDLPDYRPEGPRVGPSKRLVRQVDLMNASFSLPFCSPGSFGKLWAWIVEHLRPGGRFAGQLFGDRDSWASIPGRTHHTKAQAESLLAGFHLEMFREDEKDGTDVLGEPKHWHVFHIVARKSGPERRNNHSPESGYGQT